MDARLICVIGGGISGQAFAALHRQQGGQAIVLEKNAPDISVEDGKSVVINATSMKLLSQLGIFAAADSHSNIANTQINSSSSHSSNNLTDLTDADSIATTLSSVRVCFQNAPGGLNINGDKLGYGISHRAILQRLTELAGNETHTSATVESISQQADSVKVCYRTADNEVRDITAAVAVIACELPVLPSPFVARQYDYQQAVISFAVAADSFPKHYAMETFSRYGIIALVPRPDSDKPVGVIICANTAAAGELSALADDELLQKINDVFEGRFVLHTPSPRFVYAPQARHVSPLASERIACLGAGATTLHPAGAQGLNMGLSDCAYLAECITTQDDIVLALKKYARRRAPIHYGMLAATSMLAAGGHLRQLPFRYIGGAAAKAMSILPWRRLVT